MPTARPPAPAHQTEPLGSYVLRVSGVPAVLLFELHDLRTGERHRFRRSSLVVDFLLRHGLDPLESDATAPEPPDGDE